VGTSEAIAREIVYALHDAWNKRDVEALIALYVDDGMTFWANVGGPDGGPLTITDKDTFRRHLTAWKDMECLSVPSTFRFEDGIGRAGVEFYIRDPRSGLKHAATYRQVVWYRNHQVLRLEEYHDAKALAAFMSMLAEDQAEITRG
jgi:ketosteroid isomerase-like protein